MTVASAFDPTLQGKHPARQPTLTTHVWSSQRGDWNVTHPAPTGRQLVVVSGKNAPYSRAELDSFSISLASLLCFRCPLHQMHIALAVSPSANQF